MRWRTPSVLQVWMCVVLDFTGFHSSKKGIVKEMSHDDDKQDDILKSVLFPLDNCSAQHLRHHDASLRQILNQFATLTSCNMFWHIFSLPFSGGDLSLRSTVITVNVAYWVSWMVSKASRGHPSVSRHILELLSHPHVAGIRIATAWAACEELGRAEFATTS